MVDATLVKRITELYGIQSKLQMLEDAIDCKVEKECEGMSDRELIELMDNVVKGGN